MPVNKSLITHGVMPGAPNDLSSLTITGTGRSDNHHAAGAAHAGCAGTIAGQDRINVSGANASSHDGIAMEGNGSALGSSAMTGSNLAGIRAGGGYGMVLPSPRRPATA